MYLLTANRELVVCFELYTQILVSRTENEVNTEKRVRSVKALLDVFEDEAMAYIALIMCAKNLIEKAHL